MGTLDIDVAARPDRQGGQRAARGARPSTASTSRTSTAPARGWPTSRRTSRCTSSRARSSRTEGLGICTVTGTKGIERERLIFRGQAVARRHDADGDAPRQLPRRGALRARDRRDRRSATTASPPSGSAHVLAGRRHRGGRRDARSRWTCATSTPARWRRCSTSAHAAADGGRRGRGLHGRVGAHLPHPADAVPPRAARRRRASACARSRATTSSCPVGALHDASEMAREVPTVMIFSSSIAGLSHTKEEDTPDEHLRMAADAFHRTCRAGHRPRRRRRAADRVDGPS